MNAPPAAANDLVVVFETHATSVDNDAGLASGWFDADLSAIGEEQAHMLGVRRRHDALAAVFCSDLTRAVRTAEIAFEGRGLSVIRDARLRECDYGALTRRSTREIQQQRSACVAAPFPDGESYEQVAARVRGWLREVRSAFAGQTVLVVGHRATFYAFEHLIRRVPLHTVVTLPWQWQPGWTYRVRSRRKHG